MSKIRFMFFMLLGAFGLMAGLAAAPVSAAEKNAHANKIPKVDVNNATEEELQELPGIGAAYAKKIVDGRPYRTAADLVKAGIPQSTVDKIKSGIKFGKVKKTKTHSQKSSKAASAADETDIDEEPVKTRSHKSSKATSKAAEIESDEPAKTPPHQGMVWVNKDTMVYHKEGDRWYGKTKNGEFMNEKDAIKFGARLSKQD